MSLFEKIRGTIETIFQIGLGGPQLKNNTGAIEARNAGDSGFAVMRGAPPVGNNDFATRQFVEVLAARYIVTAQFDGNNALPSNSGVEHFIVVSTTGPNASIGQILYDDGSGGGTVTVISAPDGAIILVTVALTGGTAIFLADSLYMWDAVTTSWINAGGSSISGSVREIRLPITNAASQSSAAVVPANAVVVEAELDITTPYSGGATITVGRTGSPSLLLGTTDNQATVANRYKAELDQAWGASALAVLVTVAGAPAAGAGFAIVKYCVPDA